MTRTIPLTFAAAALAFLASLPGKPAAAQELSVTVNNAPITFDRAGAVREQGHVLLPVRTVFEKMVTGKVSFDPRTKTVRVMRGENTLILSPDINTATVNGDIVTLSAPMRIRNKTALVPLRAIAENFGVAIEYDVTRRHIDIAGSNFQPPTAKHEMPIQQVYRGYVAALDREAKKLTLRLSGDSPRMGGALRTFPLPDSTVYLASTSQYTPQRTIDPAKLTPGMKVEIVEQGGSVWYVALD